MNRFSVVYPLSIFIIYVIICKRSLISDFLTTLINYCPNKSKNNPGIDEYSRYKCTTKYECIHLLICMTKFILGPKSQISAMLPLDVAVIRSV